VTDGAWTSERLKLLKQLWAEGETAAIIGDRLGGLSRSAVLGKVFRLRLGPRALMSAAAENPRHEDQDAADHSTTQRDIAPPTRRRRSAARAEPPREVAKPIKRRGKSLLELTNHCCRWPHGRPGTKTFFFCGADGADLERGMPYCPRHAKRAYVGGEGSERAGRPSVVWSTLRAAFAPDVAAPRQRRAANGSRS
jgi:GcrA cell cycle regulator